MEKEEAGPSCPRCGAPMLDGYLTGPVELVHVESVQSFEGSALQALICPKCGHIELRAETPENLTQKDISDEELASL